MTALREASEDFEDALLESTARSRHRRTEDAFLRVAVDLERFMSEWFVRALAEDPEPLRRLKEVDATTVAAAKVREWAQREFGDELADSVELGPVAIGTTAIPRQPTLAQSRIGVVQSQR